MLKNANALIAIVFAFFSLEPQAALVEQTLTTSRTDGSPIQIMVSRPTAAGKMPIVLAIDGSLCIPSRLNDYMGSLAPDAADLGAFALLTVEKPEPTQPAIEADGSISIGPDFQCSDTFKKYYSIDQRVFDHLRAVQYLRRNADWWDGRLFLWGFSDGARIASRLGAFTPETERMVLGGLGGGMSMAVELEDFLVCPKDRTQDRAACLGDLRAQFKEIRDNPTKKKTWNGDANTWAAWATRLDGVEANTLSGVNFPILMFHGTEDKSVPVASARLLAERLRAGRNQLIYREIEGMGHGLGSKLSPEKGAKLQRDFLAWLLGSSEP